MGYHFRGFFSDGDEAVMTAALDRWPFCSAKAITEPFHGFGVRAPDPDESDTDEEYDRLVELSGAVEDGLTALSQVFPAARFVFVDADCHGGTCVYTGFAAQAGEVFVRVDDVAVGTESLERLLEPLGVRLADGYFAPFERGYW